MMVIILSVLAVLGGMFAFQLYCVSRAPMGYQDGSGFHFGTAEHPVSGDTEFLPTPEFAFPEGRQYGPTPRPVVALSGNHA